MHTWLAKRDEVAAHGSSLASSSASSPCWSSSDCRVRSVRPTNPSEPLRDQLPRPLPEVDTGGRIPTSDCVLTASKKSMSSLPRVPHCQRDLPEVERCSYGPCRKIINPTDDRCKDDEGNPYCGDLHRGRSMPVQCDECGRIVLNSELAVHRRLHRGRQ